MRLHLAYRNGYDAKLAEKDKAKMMEQIPLRQFGQPEDVANVCVAWQAMPLNM